MRITLNELMDKLGVGFVPGPYETVPWSAADDAKGITASAEVRMGPNNDEVEGEVQFMYETPPEGKGSMEHICYLKAQPSAGEGLWTVTVFRLRNEAYGADQYNWQEKSCVFFQLIVQALSGGVVPVIDDLLEDAFRSRERWADQRGSGGGKSPKIRPSQLLDMKKGRGF